ncbi:MAG TPA: lyase [Blastocatellia bacterium]|nr:lyase [Blastocatellia bacterium]
MLSKCFAPFLIFVSVLFPLSRPADKKVVIKEWDIKTANAFPHDPAVAPDGALWYTGQAGNLLGRLDTKTGEIKEYPLKTPNSGPHGLVADNEGNIWYTGNHGAHIGKLNPKTGEVTEYAMPDPRARDPHTPIFDQKGILWFTVQQGNFVGRLDPKTGRVTLKESPTPNSRPYGIVINSKGTPFFCEFNSNKIASINAATMEITEYALPEGARPRRLTITPDDIVYYSDYARGFLGRLDSKSGKVEEWPSPGGPQSRPYAIAATSDGAVWYSESGVTPNTIVRFDPKTKTFASWPVPSGGKVIRHMVATPQGKLYIACSGAGKVGVVEIGN